MDAATTSTAGQLLLALPGIGDPRFEQAVIAMCAHNADGALGVGIGQLVPGLTVHDLMRQVGVEPGVAPDRPIHLGGPVEMQRGFVLHSPDWRGGDTLEVAGEDGAVRWALTGTLDVLSALAEGTGPARWLLALGYAGWGEGQLDAELCRHGWLALPAGDALVFDAEPAERWASAFRQQGIDPRLLAPEGGRA